MSRVVVSREKLVAIADALREKTGKTKAMSLDEMPNEITNLQDESEYRKVDYIRFTGSQVIDTGVVCSQATKLKALFSRDDEIKSYLYGVLSTDNTASVTAYLTSGSGNWRFGDKTILRGIFSNEEIVHASIIDKNGIIGNTGTANYGKVSNFSTIGSLILGGYRNIDGTIGDDLKFVGKIFSFAIWQGDTLVRYFIPALDRSSRPCLYDKVSGEFFYNQGSDEFLYGELV